MRKKVTNTKKFPLFKHYSVTTEGKSVYLFSPFFTINMSSQLENNRKICSDDRQRNFPVLLNKFKNLVAFFNMTENMCIEKQPLVDIFQNFECRLLNCFDS